VTETAVVAGRACAGCTLCCKLVPVAALTKPRATWCRHCRIGEGCTIYADRPAECRDFHCAYLLDPALDAAWQPERCKLVVAVDREGTRIVVHVDPGRPDAWRKEPYYGTIKRWAIAAVQARRHVLIALGANVIVVFPNREKHLGAVREDQFIYTFAKPSAAGVELDACVLEADDPRVPRAAP
jgi:hypothetical protein